MHQDVIFSQFGREKFPGDICDYVLMCINGKRADGTKRMGLPFRPYWEKGLIVSLQTWIQFFTGVTLVFSVGVSAYVFVKNYERQKYAYLAQLWYELNKLGFDHPEFLDEGKTANYEHVFCGQDRLLYENYARMYWGYVYDIWEHGFVSGYDYTIKRVKKTHYVWFERNVREQGYDQKFVDYISSLTV